MNVLTMPEVAKRLRCSKGHVSKLINGKVKGTPALRHVDIGRRKYVLEATLEEYLQNRENSIETLRQIDEQKTSNSKGIAKKASKS